MCKVMVIIVFFLESQLSDYDSISIEMKPEESKFKTESVLMIKGIK